MTAQLPAHLQNRNRSNVMASAISAGLGSASPPYVSIKGGSFTLVDANGEQDPIETKYLDCVIFDVNEKVAVQRVFWGDSKPYDPGADAYQAPVCFSDNGIGASVNAAQPQSANCQTCKWNAWGSATSKLTGKPVKACSVIKKLCVLVDGYEFPFLLRVPVMSHENLRIYAAKFDGRAFGPADVTTRVLFVHGQVGQLDFSATGFVDEETSKLADKILDSKVTDAMIGRGDQPVQGVLPPPASAPAALPPQTQAGSAPAMLHPQAQGVSQVPPPIETAQGPLPAEPPKQKRTRKAAAPPASAPFGAPPPDDSVPPFLQPFLQRQAPPAPAPATQPPHGIVTNAPAPNAELEATLQNVFGLKTS